MDVPVISYNMSVFSAMGDKVSNYGTASTYTKLVTMLN